MESKNKINGIIYSAKNIITGQYYIGATTRSIDERKKDHLQKSEKKVGGYFQEAIATYSPESFIWEQVDTASTIDELAAKEINYIQQFDSLKNGYNSDKGGGFKKTIFQFDTLGRLVKEFPDLATAAASIGVSKKTLSKALWNVNHTLGGFFWSCSVKPSVFGIDNRKKVVRQFDLQNNLIATFNSIADAARELDISKCGIAKCCRGERKSCAGFIWEFK